MKKSHSFAAFTLIELLVVIAIIAILAGIAVPAITGGLDRARMADMLANARALTQATQVMSLDSSTGTGDSTAGWPGSGADWATFCQALVDGKYVTQADLRKFCGGPQVQVSPTAFPPDKSAIQVYGVSESDESDSIFISSYNWTGFTELSKDAIPFGDKGFVIFRKGGGGSIYKAKDATSENLGNKNLAAGFAPGPGSSGGGGK